MMASFLHDHSSVAVVVVFAEDGGYSFSLNNNKRILINCYNVVTVAVN